MGALQRTQDDLERAKGDVRSLMDRLDTATARVGHQAVWGHVKENLKI